jgi:hypothetical protein
VIPSEYDPFQAQRDGLRYSARRLLSSTGGDPLKKDNVKLREEQRIIHALNPEQRLLAPRARGDLLDIRMWSKLEATPHGRYSSDGGDSKTSSRRRRATTTRAAGRQTMKLSHYDIDRDPSTVKRQFFRGGLRMAKPNGGSRRIRTKDIITHTLTSTAQAAAAARL